AAFKGVSRDPARARALYDFAGQLEQVAARDSTIFTRFTNRINGTPANERMFLSLEARLHEAILNTGTSRLRPEQFESHLALLHNEQVVPVVEREAILGRLRALATGTAATDVPGGADPRASRAFYESRARARAAELAADPTTPRIDAQGTEYLAWLDKRPEQVRAERHAASITAYENRVKKFQLGRVEKMLDGSAPVSTKGLEKKLGDLVERLGSQRALKILDSSDPAAPGLLQKIREKRRDLASSDPRRAGELGNVEKEFTRFIHAERTRVSAGKIAPEPELVYGDIGRQRAAAIPELLGVHEKYARETFFEPINKLARAARNASDEDFAKLQIDRARAGEHFDGLQEAMGTLAAIHMLEGNAENRGPLMSIQHSRKGLVESNPTRALALHETRQGLRARITAERQQGLRDDYRFENLNASLGKDPRNGVSAL
ncbi:MAG: hypothetical protein KDD62_15395, partial [Bdellovibrionales bacterium]|nr:hypothetical protein [Bdellovibrionales bacterium]